MATRNIIARKFNQALNALFIFLANAFTFDFDDEEMDEEERERLERQIFIHTTMIF